MKRRPRFATRMMLVQTIVVLIGTVTLIVTALLVAPTLFHQHLGHFGMATGEVQLHAEEAFAYAFFISVAVATVISVAAAGVVSWILVRRVTRPIEQLATAAESVAAGRFDVVVPDAGFSSELARLTDAFTVMATRLGDSEAARSRLLADLAHELRTPLATLEAYIDGLEDQVLAPSTESWDTMRHQVHRLNRLARDLRETAAAAEHALGMEFSPIDLRASCETAVAAAAPGFQVAGLTLTLDTPAEALPVLGDEVRLQQVLANLLENALRYTPASHGVQMVARRQATEVSVQIIDEGSGIPAEEIERIFERFHRLDPARVATGAEGSGLGLTIARAIVIDHGGSLTAASDGPGKGSTFTIRLPRIEHLN